MGPPLTSAAAGPRASIASAFSSTAGSRVSSSGSSFAGGGLNASLVLEATAIQAAVKKLDDTLEAGVAAGEAWKQYRRLLAFYSQHGTFVRPQSQQQDAGVRRAAGATSVLGGLSGLGAAGAPGRGTQAHDAGGGLNGLLSAVGGQRALASDPGVARLGGGVSVSADGALLSSNSKGMTAAEGSVAGNLPGKAGGGFVRRAAAASMIVPSTSVAPREGGVAAAGTFSKGIGVGSGWGGSGAGGREGVHLRAGSPVGGSVETIAEEASGAGLGDGEGGNMEGRGLVLMIDSQAAAAVSTSGTVTEEKRGRNKESQGPANAAAAGESLAKRRAAIVHGKGERETGSSTGEGNAAAKTGASISGTSATAALRGKTAGTSSSGGAGGTSSSSSSGAFGVPKLPLAGVVARQAGTGATSSRDGAAKGNGSSRSGAGGLSGSGDGDLSAGGRHRRSSVGEEGSSLPGTARERGAKGVIPPAPAGGGVRGRSQHK